MTEPNPAPTDRLLVTRETVSVLFPIEGADAIEGARVKGWDVVVKKGEVAVGDPVLYVEIDAALPLADARFAFLEARGAKTLADGRRVHVLKTARLRGQYSQGMLLPLANFPDLVGIPDDGLAAALGVEKYEPPVPAQLSGQMRGAFPTSMVRKTDAERVQNLTEVYATLAAEGDWVATEKIDGSSLTVIVTGDAAEPFRVCSRNWELVPDPALSAVQVAVRHGLDQLPAGTIVQGELYGEGIQANPLGVTGTRLAVYGVFSAPHTPLARDEWPESLQALAVPVLDLPLPPTVEEAVAQADGINSVVSPGRKAEGIVWHERSGKPYDVLDGRSCWKVVSNRYLLKHG